MIGLEAFPQSRRFDWRQSVVHIVEKVDLWAELPAHPLEELGNEVQVALGAPGIFHRSVLLRRLVIHLSPSNAIRRRQPGNSALNTDRFVSKPQVVGDGLDRRV